MYPTVGNPGDLIAITVSNVGNSTTVDFNGTTATIVQTWDLGGGDTEVDVNVPSGASSGDVHVQTGGATLDAGAFTVNGSTNPSNAPLSVVSATLEDANGSHVVDAGDQLTVTFSGPVTVNASDPSGQIALLVSGDCFGNGATMAAGQNSTDVVITLGQNPHIRVTGTFDPNAQGAYLASGVDVDPNVSGLADQNGMAPVAASGVDIGSQSFAEGSYTIAPALNNARGCHTATLLDDGRVLVVGGFDASGQQFPVESEIFDPVANTFTNVSDPSLGGTGGYLALTDSAGNGFYSGRFSHVAVKLADGSGRVLVAGGFGFEDVDETQSPAQPIFSQLASSFVFDPSTNTFTQTGSLSTARQDAMAIALDDGTGRVIVFGGRDANGSLSSSEIFDPSGGQWTAGPDLQTGCYDATFLGTPNGIYVAGGAIETNRGQANQTISVVGQDQVYDPSQAAFVPSGSSLSTERFAAAGGLLDTGDVLVFGGDDGNSTLTSIERFDSAQGAFVSAGDLNAARERAVASKVEGDTVAVGGMVFEGNVPVTVDSLETVNANGALGWFGLNAPRLSHTVTQLSDGRVLIVGGFQSPQANVRGLDGTSNSSCEVYVRP
jgi:hypothetical protein